MERREMPGRCLVHLASGVGNVVLATPLLLAVDELGYEVDVCLDADYTQTGDLLQPWSVVRAVHDGGLAAIVRALRSQSAAGRQWDMIVPAVPPFYWARFARAYDGPVARACGRARVLPRPPERLFALDEQAFYLSFARALGYSDAARPAPYLPIGPRETETRVGPTTVVLAPGCKTGTMAAKRWPFFEQLAERFEDVVVVGTSDDLRQFNGAPMRFPPHVRSFVDRLTLRETAELMAGAAVVVGNDSGLSHVAGACGIATLMLFGPTDHQCLGPLPPNVTVLRAGLPCEPCWRAAPLAACARRVDCLARLDVDRVERATRDLINAAVEENRDECAGLRAE
jgi:ADP-heptose:LPS heptosyltransferase